MQEYNMMKHEWKKNEKAFYLPRNKPEIITVPSFKYFTIHGQGNPNDEFFGEYIGVLYSLSYAIRMSHKSGFAPYNYYEYTVYPLEGVWDITEEAKRSSSDILDKNALVFDLMIRQPDFVTPELAREALDRTKKKKPHPFLENVQFSEIEDGLCVQMMHMGSYDDESSSFAQMEKYCAENGLFRKSKMHREIYISDVRKVSPNKLKTVLRFKVVEKNDR